ncbi:hypothetical protein PoB_006330100 [Plakobranchus ocellatus]|uniref:Uncharacterized protein n=1 Tax=Plakobranchus ocellatus TaxID=259542 RepID=A0AAV4CYI6_9GAST|nr:hypothetical protein PoB_006330100 [Plakobranchus ocellatus]
MMVVAVAAGGGWVEGGGINGGHQQNRSVCGRAGCDKNHSRDVQHSVDKAPQKDTLEEFESIDPSSLFHVDEIMSKLCVLEDEQHIESSSLLPTAPGIGEKSHTHPISNLDKI